MDDRQQTRRFWGLIAFAALALLGFLSGSFFMLGIGALGLLFVVLALPGASSGLSAPPAKRSRSILQDVKIAVAARPQSPTAVELTHRLGMVRHMSGPQFERFVADVLGGVGYRATVLGGTGDQGVDVIATRGSERIAVQCKNHAKPVGNKPVQEVYAGAQHHRCTAAWVVAPEGFTKGAVDLARSVAVSLHDAQALRGWIRQIDAKERAENAREDNKKEITLASERSGTVDLDARSTRHTEGRMTERNMEKHTLTVGSARLGETVRFTAEVLGTTHVNGGTGGDLDVTFYQLPDHTYRVLMETEDASMLEPSNMSEALPIGEPAEYGSYTLEEINAHDLYGPALEALMKVRTEGESRKNTVRDLD